MLRFIFAGKPYFKSPIKPFFLLLQTYISGTCLDHFQWDLKNEEDFHFRLKISDRKDSTGELLVVGPRRREIEFDTINLTPELMEMDGKIIECHRIDNQWIFHHLRTDRTHPNGRRSVTGI